MKGVHASLGEMQARAAVLVECASLSLAVLLVTMLPGGGSDSMPQAVKGEGALAVAFGDARETISRAFVHKADSYFHGGVDMECKHLGEHGGHEHEDCHDGHDHEGCHDEHDHGEETQGAFDPWRWINSHVRAPAVHVHLEGEKAVEMMPWFWASVKADPHNVEAWTTALYVADHTVKNEKLAAVILEDAKKANPRSMEIAFAEGCFLYRGGKGCLADAEAAFANARRLGLESCGGDLSRLSEHDADVFLNVLDCLSALAAKRGDARLLPAYLDEAKKIDPGGIVSKNVSMHISALETSVDIR